MPCRIRKLATSCGLLALLGTMLLGCLGDGDPVGGGELDADIHADADAEDVALDGASDAPDTDGDDAEVAPDGGDEVAADAGDAGEAAYELCMYGCPTGGNVSDEGCPDAPPEAGTACESSEIDTCYYAPEPDAGQTDCGDPDRVRKYECPVEGEWTGPHDGEPFCGV